MSYLRIGPLVRAVTGTSAVLWVECTQPCTVIITALAENGSAEQETTPLHAQMHTITVSNHYYAAPELRNLQPATWYRYHITIQVADGTTSEVSTALLQCFRTLADTPTTMPLRLAYGSCRKPGSPEVDALSLFGSWLTSHIEQRDELWPSVLLLIGDQIYADQPSEELLQHYPQLVNGATTFEEFTLCYQHAWMHDTGTRQALALIPSSMIFDDHEVYNNWNTSTTWRAEELRDGKEALLVDALVAYWVYQGWGNIYHQHAAQHPLLTIMQDAERTGEDAFSALYACIRQEVYAQRELPWHYQIPTIPPIFVANARTNRSAVFSNKPDEIFAPMQIMGQQQISDLYNWMLVNNSNASLLVSSVPALLPPVIGFAEYLMGVRPFAHSIAPLHKSGLLLARLQHKIAIKLSFDHWPLYSQSWHALVHLLDKRKADVLLLSGDVHFSYTLEARRFLRPRTHARFYQLVCTPLQNMLEEGSRKLINKQAIISRFPYGGLFMRMLPLLTPQHTRMPRNLLWQNSLALVTLQLHANGSYTLQQAYLGAVNGQMDVVATIEITR